MKTGIVTFHSAHNYGASLQVWAMQKTLKKLGADPVIINYRPEVIERLYHPLYDYSGGKKLAVRLWKKILRNQSLRRSEKYEAFIRKTYRLTEEYRTFEELSKASFDLDSCIVGSDQVWNIQHTGGYDPAYFLEFLPDNVKKISYAASVGTDYILPGVQENFARGLKSFTGISVREVSARPLIQELTDQPVDVVLDPTLLLDREEYEELKTSVTHKEKYILVYMMEKNPNVIQLANRFSRILGLPIVQRRPNVMFQNELKPCYVATPDEFLDYVEQAEYVITNSFHGTVFSIIYEKPFISMLHSDTGSRTADLLKTLELESHLVWENETWVGYDRFEIKNRERTRKLLEQHRSHSLDFLKRTIM